MATTINNPIKILATKAAFCFLKDFQNSLRGEYFLCVFCTWLFCIVVGEVILFPPLRIQLDFWI